jgi:peptidoglycan/LPS O-acetylase OafA/YrhL
LPLEYFINNRIFSLYRITESISLLSFLGFGHNYGGGFLNPTLWSVGAELWAYLVFFGLCVLYRKHKSKLLFTIPIFMSLIAINYDKAVTDKTLRIDFASFFVAEVFTAFFIGMFTFWLYDYSKKSPRLKKIFSITPLIVIFVFIFCLVTGNRYFNVAGNRADYHTILSVIFFPAVIIAVLNVKVLRNFFSLGLFRWLGNLSFSVYVWHYPVFVFLSYVHRHIDFNIESKKVILIVFAIILVVSHFSYYFFEVPVQKFIRNKYYKYKAEKAEKSSPAL